MPAAVSSAPAGERRLYWIDWLRFLAAFAVVVDHVHSFNWVRPAVYPDTAHPVVRAVFISLCTLGKQAVVVFFVLSGWLVGGHTIRKMRAGTFDPAAYAADRTSRVYVPLVPALMLTIAIVRGLDLPVQGAGFAVCLCGLQNVFSIKVPGVNGPLWTLGYEIWFYVLAGCAAVACRRASGTGQRTAGIVGSALAVGVCIALDGTYLVCWLLGAVGFRVRECIALPARPWAALAGTVVMAAGTVVYQADTGVLPEVPPAIVGWLPADAAQLVVGVGALLLIASVVSLAPVTRAGRWIEKAGASPAAFSYTLYLTHYPVLYLLAVSFGSRPPAVTASSLWQAITWAGTCVGVALGCTRSSRGRRRGCAAGCGHDGGRSRRTDRRPVRPPSPWQ